MKKAILYVFLTLIAAMIIIAADGDQTQFGNSTVTTCRVGGSNGIINCTGDICTDGGNCLSDITSGDGYPKDQAVNTTSSPTFNQMIIDQINFTSGGILQSGS